MKVIIGARFKGGQGTSTTMTTLQNGLCMRGYKPLLIDLDEQGNSTIALGGDTNSPTMYQVVSDSISLYDAIQHTKQGDVIAGNTSLKSLEALGMGDDYLENLMLLRSQIDTLQNYDYILIDTPPRISGFLIESALSASDEIIIPLEASSFATTGLPKLEKKIEVIRKHINPTLKINGVLLTRHNPRLLLSSSLVDAVKKWAEGNNTRIYNTYIREGVAVKEAQALHVSLFEYAPESNPSKDYTAWLNEFLEVE